MTAEIVKQGGGLQTLDEQAFLTAVAGIDSDERAREFLSEMLEAKEAVMNIRRLAHLRVQFTHLENMAYMELYEKGYKSALREINVSLAAACTWVAGLGEDERGEVMSGEQGTIMQLYKAAKQAMRKEEAAEYALQAGESYRRMKLDAFKKTGKVVLTTDDARKMTAHRHFDRYIPNDYIRDLVDGTKDKVLKAGGYGIGDGSMCA